jgi:hypothetical protein
LSWNAVSRFLRIAGIGTIVMAMSASPASSSVELRSSNGTLVV